MLSKQIEDIRVAAEGLLQDPVLRAAFMKDLKALSESANKLGEVLRTTADSFNQSFKALRVDSNEETDKLLKLEEHRVIRNQRAD